MIPRILWLFQTFNIKRYNYISTNILTKLLMDDSQRKHYEIPKTAHLFLAIFKCIICAPIKNNPLETN